MALIVVHRQGGEGCLEEKLFLLPQVIGVKLLGVWKLPMRSLFQGGSARVRLQRREGEDVPLPLFAVLLRFGSTLVPFTSKTLG